MGVSGLLCGGLISLLVTALLGCISLATPSWVQAMRGDVEVSAGIWQSCTDLKCVMVQDQASVISNVGNWLYVIEASLALGFALYLSALVITMVVSMAPSLQHKHEPMHYLCVTIFMSTLIFGYGTFLFAYEMNERVLHKEAGMYLSMSFYTAIATLVAGLLTSALYRMEYVSQTRTRGVYIIIN